jgi:hypothetical protein
LDRHPVSEILKLLLGVCGFGDLEHFEARGLVQVAWLNAPEAGDRYTDMFFWGFSSDCMWGLVKTVLADDSGPLNLYLGFYPRQDPPWHFLST